MGAHDVLAPLEHPACPSHAHARCTFPLTLGRNGVDLICGAGEGVKDTEAYCLEVP
jgi:hypothetical protein